MSDWRRKNEETDEADFAELMELEEELSYEDGYLHKKRSARQAELRKKRKRNQLIREIILIALFVIATIVIIIVVRKCTGDDKKPNPSESQESTPKNTTEFVTDATEDTTKASRETEFTVPTRLPDVTTEPVPQTEPTDPPATEPPTEGPTEAQGMIYNGVQLPPYRPLQPGASVAVQSGITMPSWVVQDLIPVDGAHRPGLVINPIKHVVIHYVGNTLSSAKDNRDYFATPPDSPVYDGRQVSSHFIIGLYGEIIQCVPLNEVAFAQGVAAGSGRPNHNWDAISIENSHYNDAGEFTSMTEDSLVKLTGWLLQAYGLPANTDTIMRHYDCSGKACPKDWADNPARYEAFVQRVADYMAAHPNIAAEYP
ncbi:MAG: N-acetylmuramoyl-L-alanine amidase [Lachnospiraceae bacterium]|nr:N-acetylmuramoyl-L-alanine amidase [Lachnospiraceae bacterium]